MAPLHIIHNLQNYLFPMVFMNFMFFWYGLVQIRYTFEHPWSHLIDNFP